MLLSDDVVLLRQLTLDDVDEWMAGEDVEQNPWFESAGPASRDNLERAVTGWDESWRTGGPVRHWAVCDHGTGGIVGGVELRAVDHGAINLTYVVFPTFRRRGIATRAGRLALAYAAAAMDSRTAVIKVPNDNPAAIAVARKLGARVAAIEATETGGISVVLALDLVSSR